MTMPEPGRGAGAGAGAALLLMCMRAGTDPTGQSAAIPAAAAAWLAADTEETRALAGTDVVALDLVKSRQLAIDAG